jgi:hypothetical protein
MMFVTRCSELHGIIPHERAQPQHDLDSAAALVCSRAPSRSIAESSMSGVSAKRLLWLGALLPLTVSAGQADSKLIGTASAFVSAYVGGNKTAVMAALSSDVSVYGGDAAEFANSRAAFEKLFDANVKLWGPSAKVGEMKHITSVSDAGVATLFFDAPVVTQRRPPATVRFATVWRKEGKTWKLAQCSSVVPTTGQSALAPAKGH